MVVDNVRNVFLGMRLVGPAVGEIIQPQPIAIEERCRSLAFDTPWLLFQLSAKSGFVYLKYSTDSLVAGDGGTQRAIPGRNFS